VSGAHRNYAEAGFVALPAPLSAADLATLRAGLEVWAGGLPPASVTARGYGILRHNLWREVPAFHAVLAQGGLARQAADLLGAAAVTLFQDNLIWKTPGTETGVQWHQDYAYWPLSAPAGVTLWLALDDADEANGCLHYIPGTHREGERQPTNCSTPRSGRLPRR
jgi:hypothetical protein